MVAKSIDRAVSPAMTKAVTIDSGSSGTPIDRLTVDSTQYTADSVQITADTTQEPEA